MHLLIAEDNQDHAELLVETLLDLCPEMHITHKTNGEEAIAFYRLHNSQTHHFRTWYYWT